MADTIQCATHGESAQTFVCSHLSGGSAGLGFHQSETASAGKPFPDAWCDDCEVIRAAHDGWNEESEKLTKIVVLCSGCYERSRIRNTRPSVSLDDLADLRWKCTTCEEWHFGPCLDFSYEAPYYWSDKFENSGRRAMLSLSWKRHASDTFLNDDYCAIENRDFFVRGLIQLPIIGAVENFCWGVWGSLSQKNYETLVRVDDDPKRSEVAPIFSWLSTQIPDYPETINLKMYAHTQASGLRPIFELERTDHPLAQEQYNGISPQRVKEIMMARLRDLKTGG